MSTKKYIYKEGDIVRPVGGGPDLIITSIDPVVYYCDKCNNSNIQEGKVVFECMYFQKDVNGNWSKDHVTFQDPRCFVLIQKGK